LKVEAAIMVGNWIERALSELARLEVIREKKMPWESIADAPASLRRLIGPQKPVKEAERDRLRWLSETEVLDYHFTGELRRSEAVEKNAHKTVSAAILAREIWERETTEKERELSMFLESSDLIKWLLCGTENTGSAPEFAEWRACMRQRRLAMLVANRPDKQDAELPPSRNKAEACARLWQELRASRVRRFCLFWAKWFIFLMWCDFLWGRYSSNASSLGLHLYCMATLPVTLAPVARNALLNRWGGEVANWPKWFMVANDLPLASWRSVATIRKKTRKAWREKGVGFWESHRLTALFSGRQHHLLRPKTLKDVLGEGPPPALIQWANGKLEARGAKPLPWIKRRPSKALVIAARKIRETCSETALERLTAEREAAEIQAAMRENALEAVFVEPHSSGSLHSPASSSAASSPFAPEKKPPKPQRGAPERRDKRSARRL